MIRGFEPPILYKKNEFDNIQMWRILVYDYGNLAQLITCFGPEKPKRYQRKTTVNYVLDDSGIPPYEVAKKEAQSRWEQQKKAGYREDADALRVRYYCGHKGITRGSRQCSECDKEALARKEQFYAKAIQDGKCPECKLPLKCIKGIWQCVAYGNPEQRDSEYRSEPQCTFIIYPNDWA